MLPLPPLRRPDFRSNLHNIIHTKNLSPGTPSAQDDTKKVIKLNTSAPAVFDNPARGLKPRTGPKFN